MCNFFHPVGAALLVRKDDKEFIIRVKAHRVYSDDKGDTMFEYTDALDGQIYTCKQVIKRVDIPLMPETRNIKELL